jgi:hypothetical protein
MKSAFLIPVLTAAVLFPMLPTHAVDEAFRAPDTIILKDGRTARGLIVKNSAHEVTLQERYSEVTYPKSEISRIIDIPDIGTEYTDINRKGDLPNWRVIVNDLRQNDIVRTFEEIPAVKVDTGVFRNVPYKSFRINGAIEFNIYGDPEDPAAIEFGVFGWKSNLPRVKKTLRAYLAGFLANRQEVAALYAVGLKEGKQQAGNVVIEVTPKHALDAFGAWWISIYNPKALDAVRLSDAEYDAITLPANQVVGVGGRVKKQQWTKADLGHASRMDDDADEVIQRGFYRDKNGVFRMYAGNGN